MDALPRRGRRRQVQQGAPWQRNVQTKRFRSAPTLDSRHLQTSWLHIVAHVALRFWSKWVPRRIKHNTFVLCVWLLGTYPLGRPVSEGWRFMFTVSFFARVGYSAAWMFITNFTLPGCLGARDPGACLGPTKNLRCTTAYVSGGPKPPNQYFARSPLPRHSLPWNEFLAQDPGRTWPVLHNIMAMVLPSSTSTDSFGFFNCASMFRSLSNPCGLCTARAL